MWHCIWTNWAQSTKAHRYEVLQDWRHSCHPDKCSCSLWCCKVHKLSPLEHHRDLSDEDPSAQDDCQFHLHIQTNYALYTPGYTCVYQSYIPVCSTFTYRQHQGTPVCINRTHLSVPPSHTDTLCIIQTRVHLYVSIVHTCHTQLCHQLQNSKIPLLPS